MVLRYTNWIKPELLVYSNRPQHQGFVLHNSYKNTYRVTSFHLQKIIQNRALFPLKTNTSLQEYLKNSKKKKQSNLQTRGYSVESEKNRCIYFRNFLSYKLCTQTICKEIPTYKITKPQKIMSLLRLQNQNHLLF